MKKIIMLIVVLFLSETVYAGFKALTWHSRANCLTINESITWEFNKKHTLRTISEHYNPTDNDRHQFDTYWDITWRSAAIHFGEGYGGWIVNGHHQVYEDNKIKDLYTLNVSDCKIYDGWWDSDHPERKSE